MPGPEREIFEVAGEFRRGSHALISLDLSGLAISRTRAYCRAGAGPLAARWPARRLPLADDGIPQHAMRRVRPADVEEILAVDGVVSSAAHDSFLVRPRHKGLFAGDEPRAHRHSLSPEAEDRDEAPPVSDAAGGNHWNRRNCVDDSRNQHRQPGRPAHMATRLHALGDDEIDARLSRRPRLMHGPHLDGQLDPASVCRLHVGARISPKENQQRDLLLEARLDRAFLDLVEDEVDAERLRGLPAHPADLLA